MLIQTLYKKGTINKDKKDFLESEIQKTGKTEEEIILEQNIISEDSLFSLKSSLTNFPYKKMTGEEVPQEMLDLIPEEASANYKMTVLFKKDDVVDVGMVYPEDPLSQNALRFLSQRHRFEYKVYLINFSDFDGVFRQRRNLESETKKALAELSSKNRELLTVLERGAVSFEGSGDAPIIKMVFVIFRHAIEGKASDIHIEPARDRLNVRFRQDGVLHLSIFLPIRVHQAIVSRIKILANLKIDESRIPQNGRFSAEVGGKEIDFRVATFPTLYGEKVGVRILDMAEGVRSFDKLGLHGRNLELVLEAARKSYGLILSSGPTGSGKTTTLYALLHELNKETVNIVAIEDPIEYSIDGVNQSQIIPEIGYTFSEGLRQVLRQDPNIIMVGEIRDEDTASLVVHAALTGHVVLSTLHTGSSAGVIPRLIDMGVKPFLIPSTLRIAISQRLVRILCERCKKKAIPGPKVMGYIKEIVKSMPPETKKDFKIPEPLCIYEHNGCEICGFTGYKGRVGVFEVLPMNDKLAELILRNPSESLILKLAQQQGMLTMAQEGIVKVIQGETTIDEITRVAEER